MDVRYVFGAVLAFVGVLTIAFSPALRAPSSPLHRPPSTAAPRRHRAAWAVVCAALLGASCHPARRSAAGSPPAPRSPAHDAAGAPVERSDGTIVSLHPVLVTARSEYFALTYLSSGLRVNGFLGRPREGSGPRPAVVWNRGGNRELGAIDARVLVPYVEAGYVAAASQYRGSGGSEGREAFGGADVADVLNLVALLRRRPEVDASRIGMVGYSRGGMMTYRALREDARRGLDGIRVAATVGGLADLDVLDERPDMLAVYLATIGCGPWSCPDEYLARSAVHWAGELHAPLLLLHGEADDRVPVEQSRRLAAAMRAARRPVKLVTVSGGDHVLSGHGTACPRSSRGWARTSACLRRRTQPSAWPVGSTRCWRPGPTPRTGAGRRASAPRLLDRRRTGPGGVAQVGAGTAAGSRPRWGADPCHGHVLR